MHGEEERQCGHCGRHWSNATTSQGMAEAVGQAMGSGELAEGTALLSSPWYQPRGTGFGCLASKTLR